MLQDAPPQLLTRNRQKNIAGTVASMKNPLFCYVTLMLFGRNLPTFRRNILTPSLDYFLERWFYQTIRRHIPKGQRHDKLKSHLRNLIRKNLLSTLRRGCILANTIGYFYSVSYEDCGTNSDHVACLLLETYFPHVYRIKKIR
jgi:hypothetical protein